MQSVEAASDSGSRSTLRSLAILSGYQIVLLLLALGVNWGVLGIQPASISLPTRAQLTWFAVSTILLLLNHAWLMTSTEFARARFRLFATPEEWKKSGEDPRRASEEGLRELARRHHAHRNTTENVVYFCLVSALLLLSSAPDSVAGVWMILFASSRLGYTYGYLSAQTGVRGLFMSLSLIALYGAGSYGLLSLYQ